MTQLSTPLPAPSPPDRPYRWRHEPYVLLALGVAGAVAFALLFPRVQPAAHFGLEVSRGDAYARAVDYLAAQGFDPDRFTERTATVDVSNQRNAFLQARVADPAGAALVTGHQPVAFWWLVFADPVKDERVEIHVAPDGRLVRFERTPPEGFAAPTLAAEAAQDLARMFMSRTQGVDWDAYRLVDAQREELEGRTDHSFTWQQEEGPGGARLRITAEVQGDVVGAWSCAVVLPPDFLAEWEARDGLDTVFNVVMASLSGLLWLVALVVLIIRFRAGEIGLRGALVLTTLFASAFFLYLVLVWPFIKLQIVEAVGVGAFVYLQVGAQLIFTSLALFVTWAAGESIAREVWPEKLHVFDGLFARRFFFPGLGRSLLQGLSLGLAGLGVWYGGVALLGDAFDVWRLTGQDDVQALSGLSLFLAAATGSFVTAAVAVSHAPLFVLGFLRLKLRRVVPAVILTILLFDPLFSTTTLLYDRWFGAALGLAVGALTYAFFLRYDLFTLLVAGFVANVLPVAGSLLAQEAGLMQAAGAAVVVVLAAAGLFGFVAARRGRVLDAEAVRPSYTRYITERERLKMELEIARRAQLRMLPRQIPRPKGLDIAALSEPAREVGGDYFDFFPFSERRLGIAVGDVSGKGMPAALYMTMLKGFLQSHAEVAASPRDMLVHVNRKFYQHAEPGVFVTLCYGVVDLDEGVLRLARAGHNPAYLFRPARGTLIQLQPPGLGIGLEGGDVFDRIVREEELRLYPGDVLVLYTDGLTEARNPKAEEFGDDRLRTVIQTAQNGTAERMLEEIRAAYHQFVGRETPHDDLTCVVIRLTD